MAIHPVILSGGSGTRLWPLSRTTLPKQFIPLDDGRSLFQGAVARARRVAGVSVPPIVVANAEQRFLVAEQLREVGVAKSTILLEPAPRNTAPAVAAAAVHALASDPDAVLLVLASDHLIDGEAGFSAAVAVGLPHARDGAMVLFGIPPTRPDTGFGYIRRGASLPISPNPAAEAVPAGAGMSAAPTAYAVDRFLEKPERAIAEEYLKAGDTYWNSGMFLLSAAEYLAQLDRFVPEMVVAVRAAHAARTEDLDFVRLDAEAFARSPSDSIDYAVIERTDRAVVVAAPFAWSDVGNWHAFWEARPKDAQGNALSGDALVEDTSGCLVHATSRMVAVLGMRDVAIVETADAVFVAPRDRAQDVRRVVARLEAEGRSEKDFHTRVYRPWGWYEGVDAGERFQVKRIMVKPGESLSLQMHHHRAEHWIVVQGTARVSCADKTFLLAENESTYIPLGSTHRLENPGKVPLHLVEVQSGSYLGEDDIVRFEDKYRR